MLPANPPESIQANSTYRQQLRELPAFRALLRAVEARFYDHIPLPDPVLDLGCGSGRAAVWLTRRGWRVTAIDGVLNARAL